MICRRFVLSGLVVIALGCEKGHAMPSQTQPWTAFAVPGIEIFVEYSSGGVAHDSVPASGVARVNGRRLRGKEAFDAVRAKTGDDPKKLAALAILFLDSAADAQLWTHAITGSAYPSDQQAVATPPHLSGDTLEYWRTAKQTADLVRCRASLKLGKVTYESGYDVAHATRLANDPAATVKAELASSNFEVRLQGIADLGALGGDAARTQLVDLALNAEPGRERIAAATALGKLGGPGVVDALGRMLLHDGYAEARQAAADALGNLHDKAARPALEQARDHDENGRVQVLADEALKKL
jgi:HEAT repeat protein